MRSFYCCITVIYLYCSAEEGHVINRCYLHVNVNYVVLIFIISKELAMTFESKHHRHKVHCSTTRFNFLSTQSFSCLMYSVSELGETAFNGTAIMLQINSTYSAEAVYCTCLSNLTLTGDILHLFKCFSFTQFEDILKETLLTSCTKPLTS
jgi:hypothetical protein